MLRARLILFICSSRREEALIEGIDRVSLLTSAATGFGDGVPVRTRKVALAFGRARTASWTNASCGATGRLGQRFLDVSFQHSDWSLCNRDANPS